jgi:hypothetical protein
MPDAQALRRKALAIVREGRCQVLISKWDGHSETADQVVFRVVSSREGGKRYCVDFLDGVWSCTCGQAEPCAHVAAVQLVTLPGISGAAVSRAVAS